MIIRKAFKFRLKTSYRLDQKLGQISGACRFAWNKALSLNLERLKAQHKILWYQELNFWSVLWKNSEEYQFLKECPSQVLQQKLKDLDKAFKDAFDKKQPLKRIPRFKKKGVRESYRFPQGFKLNANQIYLPKLGWISYFKSRNISGVPKNVTVSRCSNKWYISIQTEEEVQEPIHPSTSIVGLDLGIKRLISLSNDIYYEPKNSLQTHELKLKKAQTNLSRKLKFSSNWKKQKDIINQIHNKVANIRRDYLHQISSTISKNHSIIVMEDLKVKNMSASAKGTYESPGKNVKAKSGLNKAILDQAWGAFKQMLEYKQHFAGGQLLLISPKYTSQTCNACNYRNELNRISQSEFKCIACGLEAHADFNAACNILRAGHAQLACGDIKTIVS